MTAVLGIDTGGTYTDSVVYDKKTNKILFTSKVLTTPENLVIGIKNNIDKIPEEMIKKIQGVVLSTTLGTNVAVEDKGCSVGLICIGPEIKETVPTPYIHYLQGGHNVEGIEKNSLDIKKAKLIIKELSEKVDTIAISGIFSVRNPEHELKIKELIKKEFSIPIVCGHEITSSLDYPKRTVTTVLNCRLLSVIDELLKAVKEVLKEKGIKDNIMILKGDGTVVGEKEASKSPVETVLSGPAASIIGGQLLTGIGDFLVVDIGGTTTDLAMVKNGRCLLNEEGAQIGEWKTKVKSVDVVTFGFGGDSEIIINENQKIEIGPRRIYPISYAVNKNPYLLDELKNIEKKSIIGLLNKEIQAYQLVKDQFNNNLSENENKIIEILRDGPHTLKYISEKMDTDVYLMYTKNLENKSIIKKIGLTPTDVLHSLGEMDKWNKESAEFLIRIASLEAGIKEEDMKNKIYCEIGKYLFKYILKAAVNFEKIKTDKINKESEEIFYKLIFDKNLDITASINYKLPVVLIGAPAKAYVKTLRNFMKGEFIVPERYQVANAVGAANSRVVKKIKGLIRSIDEQYVCYLPWGRRTFTEYEEALEFSISQINDNLNIYKKNSYLKESDIKISQEEKYLNPEKKDFLLETIVEGELIGYPKWD